MEEEALRLFTQMEAEASFVPCETTMASVLPVCARSKEFAGKELMHKHAHGHMDVARRIFAMVDLPDIVSWNTLITGCVVQGHVADAFQLVRQMQQQEEDGVAGVVPNAITLMTLLPGCAILAASARGKEVHMYAVRHVLDTDVAVESALVDMYAKCGWLALLRAVFDRLPRWNTITWNVLVMAYGMHGLGGEAMALFNRMTASGEANPNEVTFIAALVACSHSGMVERGL
uniref:Pentatricopeptide repeat-containing protein n=1 Tax=Oryza glumipatula TaxID=40148 RepID=A0A0E0BVL4_9ORYZ